MKLIIMGPSVADLALFLARYDWVVRDFEQTTTMSGYILADHPLPRSFLGIGINDGTYILDIEEEEDSDGQDHPVIPATD